MDNYYFEHLKGRKRPMKLNLSVSLMVSAVILTVLLVVHLVYFYQISDATRESVKDKAVAVARTLADSPDIQRGLLLPPASNIIQPVASAVVQSNDLLYVVVTNMQGIRFSHPKKEFIGEHFIGEDLQPALKNQENVSVNKGKLATALRAFTPVYDAQKRQIGVVVVGIEVSDIDDEIARSRWNVLWTALFGLLAGAIGTWCLVKASRRILSGLEPYEVSMLFEQRQAMLYAIKEGVVAVDNEARVTLINHAARKLFRETGMPQALEKEIIQAIETSGPLLASLRAVLLSGTPQRDEEIHFNGRILLCNTRPVISKGRVIGAICSFRDKTEVTQLTQRLSGMADYADSLRQQSHEFMNKLHVILGLLHMKSYSQLEAYILKTASNYQSEIGSLLKKIRSPVIAGFLLSKISHASDQGHRLTLSEESFLPDGGSEQQVSVLITVLGNLIENALDALGQQPDGEVNVLLHYQNGWLSCEVSDDGPGIPPGQIEAIFEKGVSSKGEQRGVGLFLSKQQTLSLGGEIIVESEPGVYTQFLVQLPWDGGNISAC
ncbi:sensor histidine kinase [Erwinia sp. E_sp_B04_7]|uniref:sensor histidine kinase n=1 Tax=Erwinia sp. E_sp_B04_7 TaxID=3039404 RepID=UPI0030CD0EA1